MNNFFVYTNEKETISNKNETFNDRARLRSRFLFLFKLISLPHKSSLKLRKTKVTQKLCAQGALITCHHTRIKVHIRIRTGVYLKNQNQCENFGI